MKANFKPLGLAAAVAAATAGYSGVVNAQTVAANGLGDLALVPYYTVQGDFGTGVHVINTSAATQVVKVRFRRGSDSLDALDFNLIMSPYDEWTGFLSKDSDGAIAISTQDTTCTSPIFDNGGKKLEMRNIYRDGADEGYVEVIAMGSPVSETEPLAVNALHGADGLPENCVFADQNFLDAYLGSASDIRGVHNNALTAGPVLDATGAQIIDTTAYTDSDDVLKVSWFIRDDKQGLEFGNDAVHIAGFAAGPMITHQEEGIFSGNLRGFDFPDLNGSAPNTVAGGAGTAFPWIAGTWVPELAKYNELRQGDVLGVSSVLNDWSNNSDLNVGTDWIVTIPGQYLMVDQPLYFQSLGNFGGLGEGPGGVIGGGDTPCGLGTCDFRDLPVRAVLDVWDREENVAVSPPGDRDTVVSPAIPGQPKPTTQLRYEVNVIHWGEEVVDSIYDEVDVSGLLALLAPANSGWAKLTISSNQVPGQTRPYQSVCTWDGGYFEGPLDLPGAPNYDPNDPMTCVPGDAEGAPPMIGFVAWQRSFPENPDGNYGRAVAHSFESGPVSNP